MNRQGRDFLGLLMTIAVLQPAVAAEVLQSISDDSVNISIQTETAEPADRRFSYRVICSPEDEALPDCLPASASENNSAKPSMVLPVPDFPAETADIEPDEQETAEPHVAEPPTKPHKHATKKQPKKPVKNSAKKTAKKPAKQRAKK